MKSSTASNTTQGLSSRPDRISRGGGSLRMILMGILIGMASMRSIQLMMENSSGPSTSSTKMRSQEEGDTPTIYNPSDRIHGKIDELTARIDHLTMELHNHLDERPSISERSPLVDATGDNKRNPPKPQETTFAPPPSTVADHSTGKLVEFEKQPGVVVASKVHGLFQWNALEQSMCLFTQAYNNRVGYDIVVFTTEEVPEHRIEQVRALVAPASFRVVIDNPGLHEMVRNMTKEQQQALLQRCNETRIENLTWRDTKCSEENISPERLGYNWQAEFRSWHIWNHEALEAYSTMIWLDSDAFCTIKWPRDPITYFLENKLAILFDNWPMGASRGEVFQERIQKSFGKQLCTVPMVDGHLWPNIGNCKAARIQQVHGFFHITNMTFFRENIHWSENLIGEGRLQRRFDDQLAVTVPTAILAPNRSRDMRQNGIHLDVFHNGRLDGKDWVKAGFKVNYWPTNGTARFPEAAEKCRIIDGGR